MEVPSGTHLPVPLPSHAHLILQMVVNIITLTGPVPTQLPTKSLLTHGSLDRGGLERQVGSQPAMEGSGILTFPEWFLALAMPQIFKSDILQQWMKK